MERLNVRDLVNVAVFSVLIMLLTFVGGMIGVLPVLMPVVPFCCGLLSGPVFMLFSTRINKPGMIFILSVLTGLLFTFTGHNTLSLIGIPILGLIAELIIRKGNYTSINHARKAYSVYIAYTVTMLFPLYFDRANYMQKLIDMGYGADYAEKLFSVMPMWSFVPVVLGGCLGAYLGCTIGIKFLKKHFKKAGMA